MIAKSRSWARFSCACACTYAVLKLLSGLKRRTCPRLNKNKRILIRIDRQCVSSSWLSLFGSLPFAWHQVVGNLSGWCLVQKDRKLRVAHEACMCLWNKNGWRLVAEGCFAGFYCRADFWWIPPRKAFAVFIISLNRACCTSRKKWIGSAWPHPDQEVGVPNNNENTCRFHCQTKATMSSQAKVICDSIQRRMRAAARKERVCHMKRTSHVPVMICILMSKLCWWRIAVLDLRRSNSVGCE